MTIEVGAPARYTTVAIGLHWLIAALIIGQIAGGLYMANLPDDAAAAKFQAFQLHKSFGLTILLLSLARLVWRLMNRAPSSPSGTPPLQARIARLIHWLFYALMIGLPLGGWAAVSASPLANSVPTYIFGVIPWPHLPFFDGVEDRGALSHQIGEMHEFGAFLLIGLLVLHVAAALKHHFIDRDGVLARMVPFLKQGLK